MIKNCIYPCIGFFSVVGRIFIFFCFWWAYDGVEEAFSDKRLGYQNEFYAWESPPIFKIQQLFSNPDCPVGTELLYNYIWQGRKSFTEDGVEYQSIPQHQFKYWVYEPLPTKKFILCATLGLKNETYAQFGRVRKTCEERKMRSCSNGRFCIPSTYQYCPITNIEFDEQGIIKTDIDPQEMPIAYFKVDTYFVSVYNNKDYNLYPDQPQDDQLEEKFTSKDIEYRDDTFIPLNTVNDQLFYSINSASDFDRTISAKYNKTLFYRRYKEWQYEALGDLFDYAYNIFDSLDEIIVLSNSGTITSLVYLLLVCYLIPALPVILRFISALKVDNIFIWDIVIRMILLLLMLAQSLYIIKQCEDVINYSNLLLNNDNIVGFKDQYDGVIELIDGQEPYHIISIAVSLGFLGIELFLWLTICLKAFFACIMKIIKQIQFKKQIKDDVRREEDMENLNQLHSKQANVEQEKLN
ncbi:unnamed protein product [Paramecium primaurelia]|uniref:Transmembrane protein n=1 Tax=Paramecium primaurelia TaxID=5886 RepID=A0A8S1LRW4_PARPR|nr:unnamed protein product [Paramecium primaurelia]